MVSIDAMAKCPVCKREALPRAQNKAYPFCSPRCRLVDLGKWLGEEYRVPGPAAGSDDEEPRPDVPPQDDGVDA